MKQSILRWTYGLLAWACLGAFILCGLDIWADRSMPVDPDRAAVEYVR